MIQVRVKTNTNEVIVKVRKKTKEIQKAVLEFMRQESLDLTTYVIERHLTGGTDDDRLAVRSGHLRRTTIPLLPIKKGKTVIAGTQFGAGYARVHIGRAGQVTKIKPVKAKWLTIPLPPARTKAGAGKRPEARDFPDLIFARKEGRDPVLGKVLPSGKIKPYFALKKEVEVKARVHPRVIFKARKGIIEEHFKLVINRALKV